VLPDDVAGGACALRVELFSCHASHYPRLGAGRVRLQRNGGHVSATM